MPNDYFQEFAGAVAAVTGAAQGIGLEVASILYRLGAKVVALDTQFTDLPKTGVRTNAYCRWHLDVADSSEVNACLDSIESTIGPIAFVAHCAGIFRLGEILSQPEDDWLSTFHVNTFGALNICRASASLMKVRKAGAIVVVGSNASLTPRIGMGAYAASKAATTMMLKCLALEVAQDNIRCNIVAPGSTNTQMQRQLWQSEADSEKIVRGNSEQYRLGIPLGRIAATEQVANTVLFMLSDMASHITMETLKVDGGATLG
ncbi:2,3-dihydro-2,3-dihydroxybenzoate dehydrogenase [Teredinibacter franksiae]|uniref:2,3-dihydro-2,3-dihydroxybenzoate dehydrogenase n=1 Tax=Teredinibacter franksiae TaxID=2761453 RepID=UPI00162893EB|nr:2,3-dihydro-2,3-dihydroxybenzoate dehydrogenase [Teredinibacter franksiae]